MALTPNELERLPKQIEKHMNDLALHIITDIADRMKSGREITRTTDYLIWRLAQIKTFDQGMKRYLQKLITATVQEIDKIFADVIELGYATDEELYKATNTPYIPYAENKELQQYVESVKAQTKEELRNITQTTGYMVKINGKKQPTPASMALQDALDKAVNKVILGATDYNTAVKDVVKELTDSDLRTVDYASGRSYSTVQAARMCVMTAVTQVAGKVTEINMQKLNTDFVEVSWHATARPSHQPWQGRVFYWDKANPAAEIDYLGEHYKSFISETGYGTMLGLCGINCYHSFFPFIPGISKRTYTDEELERMQAEENEKKEWHGKKYTKYQATQAMRKLENKMRKQRQQIKALKTADGSEDDITIEKCKYSALLQQYRQFADVMKLPQEMNRVYADGLGRL